MGTLGFLTLLATARRRALLGLRATSAWRQHTLGAPVTAPTDSPHWTQKLRCFGTSADSLQSIHKLVVANRGEIACRVFTTARRLGIPTVAVYSDADRASKHIRLADEAFHIGGAAARDSYLRPQAILDVCHAAGGRSVHPGYGFLSENAGFADACHQSGVAFVGPPGSAIRAMGNKSEAKRIMSEAGVPVVPGYHGDDQSEERLLHEAQRIGFPLLVKAVSGGGGKGMKLALALSEVREALASAKREAASSFGDDRVLLERYIRRPRHVEVQVVCDAHGNAVYLFDRDCSMQRRHQKVIEEAPAPGLSPEFHRHIGEAAVRAARAVGYVNAGTVEFIVDTEHPQREFYFMEMNTRLQVEHPVTEEVSGVDLVEWQLRVAAGQPLPLTQQQLGSPRGHSFEARLYAESPRRGFLPGAGTLTRWRLPPGASAFSPPHNGHPSAGAAGPAAATAAAAAGGATTDGVKVRVRVDSGVEEGDSVGTWYDPMIAKVITWGPDRRHALAALSSALSQLQVSGLPSNLEFLKRLAAHPRFIDASDQDLPTAFIAERRDELLAPAVLPDRAAALAGVARHLLEINAPSSLSSSSSSPAMSSSGISHNGGAGVTTAAGGAWGIMDSKRLWSHTTRCFKGVGFPEGEGGRDADLGVAVTVLSGDAFDVKRLRDSSQTEGAGGTAAKGAGVAAAAGMGAAAGGGTGAGGTLDGEPHKHHPHQRQHQAGASPHCGVVEVRGAKLHLGIPGQTGGGGAGAGGVFTAEVDGRQAVADVILHSQGAWRVLSMWVNGHAYELRWQLPDWSKDAGAQPHHSPGGKVLAPMPGRAVKVMVKDGDVVEAGAPLVVLEAMKMENVVVAPRPGVVREVAVAVGAQVADGQVLLWVEQEEGAKGKGKDTSKGDGK